MDRPAAKVRGTVVPWWELPGEAACLLAAANDPALAAYHADGEPLVARAMLHELERIMHPSRALNTVRACVLMFPMMGRALLPACSVVRLLSSSCVPIMRHARRARRRWCTTI